MRIRFLLSFFCVVWIVLLARVYYISIQSNAYYDELAKQNAIKTEYLAPVRGMIYDVNGEVLSANKLGFSISIKPHLSSKKGLHVLENELDFLTETLKELNKEEIKKSYLKQDSPYSQNFVVVENFLPYDSVLPHMAKLSQNSNIQINSSVKRFYPNGKIASHIIGYVGKANEKDMQNDPLTKLTKYVGKAGIERFYHEILQGSEGQRKSLVTAFNEEVEELSKTLPNSTDISLTIDLRLQKYLAEIFGDDAGVAIVMDAHDGSILAAGSYPEYDINKFVNGISHQEWQELSNDLSHPFTNKIINGLYPPGSVIKMGMVLAFLNSYKITKNTTVNCEGSFELGNRNFRCWKLWGHGEVNMKRAIRESCDDYFYKGSLTAGIDIIAPTMTRLGFGQKTGVDLPNEFIGIMPSRDWKMQRYRQPWYQGDTLNTSIGQGNFMVTPLQVAKHTAIFATKKGVTPHFIKSINGKEIKYKVDENILSDFEKKHIPHIQEAMFEVATHPKGTGRRYLKDISVEVAAKTGTAQVVGISQKEKVRIAEEDMDYYSRSHAWITTYGPYKNPKYVVTVLLEHGGHGGRAAGPVITKIYDKLLELGYIQERKANKK